MCLLDELELDMTFGPLGGSCALFVIVDHWLRLQLLEDSVSRYLGFREIGQVCRTTSHPHRRKHEGEQHLERVLLLHFALYDKPCRHSEAGCVDEEEDGIGEPVCKARDESHSEVFLVQWIHKCLVIALESFLQTLSIEKTHSYFLFRQTY